MDELVERFGCIRLCQLWATIFEAQNKGICMVLRKQLYVADADEKLVAVVAKICICGFGSVRFGCHSVVIRFGC